MAKQSLLLVDADPKSARVLEVSLRKAGYSVTHAENAEVAFSHADVAPPHLILSDTQLPGVDGFQLLARLRAHPTLREVPFMFLSGDSGLESKRRGLELGVEYLTKPAYLREVITRVALELQRHERKVVEQGTSWNSHMAGSLSEMGVVDLLQLIERGEKSGVLHVHSGTDRVDVYFTKGRVIDAVFEKDPFPQKRGADAVYRAMTWSDGLFDLEFSQIEREQILDEPMQALLMEGMRRLDETGRLLEQLPPLESVFEVDGSALADRLSELPDRINGLLRHIDGNKNLQDVVDASGWDDVEALETMSKLFFEGMIVPAERGAVADELASPTEPPEKAARAISEQPLQTEIPPGGPIEALRASADMGDTADADVSDAEVSAQDDSEATAMDGPEPAPKGPASKRKGRRRQKERRKKARASGDRRKSKSNVIQFPNKSAVAFSAGHVAVNDGVAVEGPSEQVATDEETAAAEPAAGEAVAASPEAGGSAEQEADGKEGTQVSESAAEESQTATTEGAPDTEDPQNEREEPVADGEPPPLKRDETDASQADASDDAKAAREHLGEETEENPSAAVQGREQTPAEVLKPEEIEPDDIPEGDSAVADTSEDQEPASAGSEIEEEPEAVEGEASAEVGAGPEAVEGEASAEVGAGPEAAEGEASSGGETAEDPAEVDAAAAEDARVLADSGEHPQLEEFFSTPPPAAADEGWDDLEPALEGVDGAGHWKNVTMALAAAAVVLVGGGLLYSNFLAPQPDQEVEGAVLELPNRVPIDTGLAHSAGEPSPPSSEETLPPVEEAAPEEVSPLASSTERSGEDEMRTESETERLPDEEVAQGADESPSETSDGLSTPPPAYLEKIAEAEGLRGRAQETAYREAYEIFPGGSEGLAAMAFIDLAARRYEDAKDKAAQALARDATSSKAWVVLGSAYQSLREPELAQEAYRSCVEQGVGDYVRSCRSMVRSR